MRALAMVAALGLAGPAAAYTVTLGAGLVGEKPSTTAPYVLPGSVLVEKPMVSTLAPVQAQSSFGLKDMDSATMAKTQASLTQLGARQEGSQIIVTLPGDVLFDFDKSDIRPDARPVLSQLSEVLLAMPDSPVEILGHTDAKGSNDYNQALSERRAGSVRSWLGDLGVDAGRMTPEGRGEAEPVAPNQNPDGSDDPEGRQQNRRVEFIIGAGG